LLITSVLQTAHTTALTVRLQLGSPSPSFFVSRVRSYLRLTHSNELQAAGARKPQDFNSWSSSTRLTSTRDPLLQAASLHFGPSPPSFFIPRVFNLGPLRQVLQAARLQLGPSSARLPAARLQLGPSSPSFFTSGVRNYSRLTLSTVPQAAGASSQQEPVCTFRGV